MFNRDLRGRSATNPSTTEATPAGARLGARRPRTCLPFALLSLAACAPAPAATSLPEGPTASTSDASFIIGPMRGQTPCAPDGEEFLFPGSPSWINLADKGVLPGDDITTALQQAVDQLGTVGPTGIVFNTVYIPAGTYLLSQPIIVKNKQGIAILGANPTATVLKWSPPVPWPTGRVTYETAPPPSGVHNWLELGPDMLLLEGVGQSRIGRLTLDGGGSFQGGVGTAGARAGIKSIRPTGTFPPELNQLTDLVFTGLEYGFFANDTALDWYASPGANEPVTLPNSDGSVDDTTNNADSVIVRCHFTHLLHFGISFAGGGNTGEWTISDSTFNDVDAGVAGNSFNTMNVWNNVFLGSRTADLFLPANGVYSVRGNYSSGSRLFINASDESSWSSQTTVLGNVVMNPTALPAMLLGSGGNYLVMDNKIQAAPVTTHPWPVLGPSMIAFSTQTLAVNPVNVVEGNNTFSQPDLRDDVFPWLDGTMPNFPLKALSVDPDLYVASIQATQPTLAATPFTTGRVTVELVPLGASPTPAQVTAFTASVQAAIDNAALHPAQRYALHFPGGAYYIDSTLQIPGGLDIALVGDGFLSTIWWRGAPAEVAPFMISLASPARATLRDLELGAENTTRPDLGPMSVLRVSAKDEATGRIHGSFLDLSTGVTAVAVNGFDQLPVRFDGLWAESFDVALHVTGNNAGAAGSQATAGVTVLGGGLSGTHQSLVTLDGYGKAVLEGLWTEGASQGVTLDASQSGYLTLATSLHAGLDATFQDKPFQSPGQPNFLVQPGFHGQMALVNLLTTAGVKVDLDPQTPTASVLALGLENDSDQFAAHLSPQQPQPLCDGASPPVCAAQCDLMMPSAQALSSGHLLAVNNRQTDGSAQTGAMGRSCGDLGAGNVAGGAAAFTHAMLNELRTTTFQQATSCTGATSTDLRLHHVTLAGSYNDVTPRRVVVAIEIDKAP